MLHQDASDQQTGSEDNCEKVSEESPSSPVIVKIPEESAKSLKNGYSNGRLPTVNLSWRRVSYVVRRRIRKEYVTILKNATGESNAGELTAILGPSGAGKTTLLNILSGLIQKQVNGKIFVNGKERRPKAFQQLICYIQQQNEVLPDLSLSESLTVAANLKLDGTIPREEKRNIIKETLDFWGLFDCKDTMVQKLSSGQRKRLSIAQEVINKPPLIFLDEPTSGLDSNSCMKCISLLKNLAKQGHNVICSIHQPTALHFEQFDRVCFLNRGECLYNGPRSNLFPFLSDCGLECPVHHNPADFVIEAVLGEYGEGKAEKLVHANSGRYRMELTSSDSDSKLESSLQAKNIGGRNEMADAKIDKACMEELLPSEKEEDSVCGYQTTFCNQFLVLFGRAVLGITRSWMVTHIFLSSYVVVALALGILFYGIGNDADKVLDNASCLFFSMVFVSFCSCMGTVMTFPLEKPVIKREIFNRWYTVSAYYLARTLADVPLQIIFPVVFGSIVYWMTGQINDAARFILFLCLLIITSLISQALGLYLGVLFRVQVSVFLGPTGILLPPMLFCGFFIRINIIPSYLRWISYVSFYRYIFEGIMLTNYDFNRTSLECSREHCLYEDPNYFIADIGMEGSSLYINFIILTALLVMLRIVVFFVLRWKVTKSS